MSTTKGTEGKNEEGAPEIKVKTVDYRAPAGEDREPKKENVEVIHQLDHKEETGGVISQTVLKAGEKVQSAKEAISGTHDQSTVTDKKSK